VVGRLAGPPRHANLGAEEQSGPTSLGGRVLLAIRTGYGEMFDATLPWVLVGLGLAALLDPILATPGSWLRSIPPGAEVAFFALLGMPAYVCASGATPLVAVLLAHGVSPGAGIAFLLTGPATNITTFGVLRELHGGKMAFAFAGTMAVAAIAVGHLTNLALGGTVVVPIPRTDLSAASWLNQASLALLAGLTLLSLLRQGPRTFISHIISADDSAEGEACSQGGSCCGGGCGAPLETPHSGEHDHKHGSGGGHGLAGPSERRA